MWIEVELSTGLTGGKKQTLRFPIEEGCTPALIADRLRLVRERVGLITVDGRVVEWMEPLSSGQRLCFFPFLAGG
jgi:hypothetical protein